MFTKNTILLGRLEEARAQIAALVFDRGSAVVAPTPPPAKLLPPAVALNKGLSLGEEEFVDIVRKKKRKKGKKKEVKKNTVVPTPLQGTSKQPSKEARKEKKEENGKKDKDE